jgi:hypothetical protein
VPSGSHFDRNKSFFCNVFESLTCDTPEEQWDNRKEFEHEAGRGCVLRGAGREARSSQTRGRKRPNTSSKGFKGMGKGRLWRRESVLCPREPGRQGRHQGGTVWGGSGLGRGRRRGREEGACKVPAQPPKTQVQGLRRIRTYGIGNWVTVPDNNGHWFDHRDHDVILFDDVEAGVIPSSSIFNGRTDRYPIQVPVKGGFITWKPRVIVFTSNSHPNQWWIHLSDFDLGAIERRITNIEVVV